MVFWPLHGIVQRLTERKPYTAAVPLRTLGPEFRRSMHLYVADAGCDNSLNFMMAALQAPQYNTHRFGIYFADSPRHADLLVLLGPPLPGLGEAVRATSAQMPTPYGVLLVGGESPAVETGAESFGPWRPYVDPETVVGHIPGTPGPEDLLGALLTIQRGARTSARRHGALR